jgi:FAD:protein FMN transferase
MGSRTASDWGLRKEGPCWVVTYTAMASPCEILVDCDEASEADHLASLAFHETQRIERKFSRYRDDNIVHAINHSEGTVVAVDEETSRLLWYAGQCFELSEGLFDVTSGVLRRAWSFDGGEAKPDPEQIDDLLQRVGWQRVRFEGEHIRMAPGMEIDLGGIGKEYTADRLAGLLAAETRRGVMVNLGGDIRAVSGSVPRAPWAIGIEDPLADGRAVGQVELKDGGVATSGDARRYCMVDGVRLGHILDPRTGWPVAGAPRSATVVADTCTAAGFLATMAMLHGRDAEAFLDAQGITHHCIR